MHLQGSSNPCFVDNSNHFLPFVYYVNLHSESIWSFFFSQCIHCLKTLILYNTVNKVQQRIWPFYIGSIFHFKCNNCSWKESLNTALLWHNYERVWCDLQLITWQIRFCWGLQFFIIAFLYSLHSFLIRHPQGWVENAVGSGSGGKLWFVLWIICMC